MLTQDSITKSMCDELVFCGVTTELVRKHEQGRKNIRVIVNRTAIPKTTLIPRKSWADSSRVEESYISNKADPRRTLCWAEAGADDAQIKSPHEHESLLLRRSSMLSGKIRKRIQHRDHQMQTSR